VGDAEGITFEHGQVRTPTGFRKPTSSSWPAAGRDERAAEYGGQGLPHFSRFILDEFLCASNLSFGMYPSLGTARRTRCTRTAATSSSSATSPS
jgi:hypothetical protein